MVSADPTQECWLELKVVCDLRAFARVINLFYRYGFDRHIVTVEESAGVGEDGDRTQATVTQVSVRSALYSGDMTADALEDTRNSLWAVRQNLWMIGRSHAVSPLELFERREEDWPSTWKESFSLSRVTDRLLTKAPWHQYAPQPGELVIEVDPGTAFGTGKHATTKQCLQALEVELKPGDVVLDVGTGSGTLAVAAALLGAAAVDALDIDPVAIRVARETAERNGVGDKIHVAFGSPGADGPFPGPYDVVVVNIIARVVAELAPALAAALKPGGALIVGGLLDDRVDLVQAAFAAEHLTFHRQTQMEQWSTFVFRKPERSASSTGTPSATSVPTRPVMEAAR
jgi:ribosomal protein L11 methyltransferase